MSVPRETVGMTLGHRPFRFLVFAIIYSLAGAQLSAQEKTTLSGLSSGPVAGTGLRQPSPSREPLPDGAGAIGGDPVDLATGLYVLTDDDLIVEDILPIRFTRTYRSGDPRPRAFGVGASHSYDLFLAGDRETFKYVDLILPSGAGIHYVRVSPGTGREGAVFEHVGTPTKFHRSRLKWNGHGWDIDFADGSLYSFTPCPAGSQLGQCGLLRQRDAQGNVITITRDRTGYISAITTPRRRGITLAYDRDHRITRARTFLGTEMRWVTYQYDQRGRLMAVRRTHLNLLGPLGLLVGWLTGRPLPTPWRWSETKEYTYDASHQMLTVKDGHFSWTNEHDPGGRVIKQSLADGSTFKFAYTLNDQGKIVQTDMTERDGSLRRFTFNAAGYPLSETHPVGEPTQLSIVYDRQVETNKVLGLTMTCSRNGRGTTFSAPLRPGETDDEVKSRLVRQCSGRDG